jgi:hypothetical protein
MSDALRSTSSEIIIVSTDTFAPSSKNDFDDGLGLDCE